MFKVDEVDKRLIKVLQENTHRSSDAVAKKPGVSPATVRRRTRSLIKEDVIRIQAVVGPEKVGLPLAVIIAFDMTHDNVDSAMRFLSNRPEIKLVATTTTTGRFDIMAIARFASTEELSQFVEKELLKLEGVKNSETFVCLHVTKPRYTVLGL